MAAPNLEHIRPLQERLNAHPIYGAIRTLPDLRVFMSHHVFSVWDFMSLVKYLQRHIAPVQVPWMPSGGSEPCATSSTSWYWRKSPIPPREPTESLATEAISSTTCEAMGEVGADAQLPRRFLALVAEREWMPPSTRTGPLPARYFTETTFCFIREDKPHLVAAALAVGRERVIPGMFRQFLERMNLGQSEAPAFHYYLSRHVHLDEDFHGPLSLALLQALCGDDPGRIEEAETAAEEAICARIRFWDGVLDAVETRRGA